MSKNYRNRSSTRPLWTCYIAITSHKKSTEYFTADVLIGRRKDVIPNKSANLISDVKSCIFRTFSALVRSSPCPEDGYLSLSMLNSMSLYQKQTLYSKSGHLRSSYLYVKTLGMWGENAAGK